MSLRKHADALFNEAIHVVLRHQVASCSLLQRQLGIGYADAKSLLDCIGHQRFPNFAHLTLTISDISKRWMAIQSTRECPGSEVTAEFFAVDSGIPFSSIDLYCALALSSDADNLNASYGVARAAGARRADMAAMTLLDSIGDRICVSPPDGLVLKITSDPALLFGRELRQICAVLCGHMMSHCVTALAIQYGSADDDLVLEVIATRITPP